MTQRFAFPFLLVLLALTACRQDTGNAAPPADAPTSGPIKPGNPWLDRGCDLVTDAEVMQMFDLVKMRDIVNTRSLPDQTFCLRTWNKKDWKERESNNEKEGTTYLNPQNRLVVQVFDYHTEEHAHLQMERLKRDRRNTYEEDVPGLGDEAVWSSGILTLVVRRGHLALHITLECTDTPHDNLLKAKDVALVALRKM